MTGRQKSAYFEIDLIKDVEDLAEKEKRSFSQILNTLIREALANRKACSVNTHLKGGGT